VYHRRDLPASAPGRLHFHGGGFYSGNKAREAKPLIRYLTSQCGFVCVSAGYRLQPHVTLAGQVADVRSAVAWVRAHAAEYGAGPSRLFITGSSAGSNLAIRAVCEGETGIAGLICRYGYYGASSLVAICHPCSSSTATRTRRYTRRPCAPSQNRYARY
jgi:acetyl esterase/lipase